MPYNNWLSAVGFNMYVKFFSVPYEPYSNTKFWDAFCEEKGLKLIDVMNDPAGELLNTVCLVFKKLNDFLLRVIC